VTSNRRIRGLGELRSGEQVILKRAANRTVGSLAVGGRLFLTTERLVFVPHAFERLLGRSSAWIELPAIAEVGAEPRTGGLFDGGLRSRLRVARDTGEKELFVVGDIGELVESISEAARGARRSSESPT
jgi:hypothetical protein